MGSAYKHLLLLLPYELDNGERNMLSLINIKYNMRIRTLSFFLLESTLLILCVCIFNVVTCIL